MSVAILGGTGPFGRALAHRLAAGGAEVRIGSRDPRRVRDLSCVTNLEAAAAGATVFLSVPFAAQESLLAEVGPALAGKLVICCAVIWPPGSQPGTSAGEEAARALPGARVAAAFQTVAAGVLRGHPEPPDVIGNAVPGTLVDDGALRGRPEPPDVLVFADDEADRAEAAEAAALTGLRAVPVGPLAASRAADAALGLLLALNRGGAKHAGLRVTGLGD